METKDGEANVKLPDWKAKLKPIMLTDKQARAFAMVRMGTNNKNIPCHQIVITIKSTGSIIRKLEYEEIVKLHDTHVWPEHVCTNEPYIINLWDEQYGSTFLFHVTAFENGIEIENFEFIIRPAKSEPRNIEDALVMKMVTVTRDKITINIRSTDSIKRQIFYEMKDRFQNEPKKSYFECAEDTPTEIDLEKWKGSEIFFHVIARDLKSNIVLEYYKFTIQAEMNNNEMKSFLTNILDRVDTSMMPAYFYRNYLEKDEIRMNEQNGGNLELNPKGHSGNQSSPLHRKFDKATYFATKLFNRWQGRVSESFLPDGGYMLPPTSPFGDIRASFAASTLLDEQSVLFLGGMHCYGKQEPRAHYITVVICQKDSLAYLTCEELGLIELVWETNPILRWEKNKEGANQLSCAQQLKREIRPDGSRSDYQHDVWVEVLLCDKVVPLLGDSHITKCDPINYNCLHISSTSCESCTGYQRREDIIVDRIVDEGASN